MQINLDRVPARETGMSAYELMLSESQERMLVVVRRGREDSVKEIFKKWDLHAEIIGEVTGTGVSRFRTKGGPSPIFPRTRLSLEGVLRSTSGNRRCRDTLLRPGYSGRDAAGPRASGEVLLRLLRAPNIASKRWVY